MIKEGETKEVFSKRKRDERKVTREFEEKTRNIGHEFSGKWLWNGL